MFDIFDIIEFVVSVIMIGTVILMFMGGGTY